MRAEADGAAPGPEPAAEPAPSAAPVAVADPPVERAAPPEPTPEESGEGVAGRPDAGAERTKPAASRKKQSRRGGERTGGAVRWPRLSG